MNDSPVCSVAGSGRGRPGVRALLFAGLALFAPFVFAHAALGRPAVLGASPARAGEIRAAMLVNFTRFVEWPSRAWNDASAPFVIGVVGADPMGSALDLAARGKRAGARPIVVRRWADVAGARGGAKTCQVLYVSGSQESVALLRELDGTPVLLVGDSAGFARRGGTMGFFIEARHLRFEINRAAAERCGLRISSKLLELARLVEGQRP